MTICEGCIKQDVCKFKKEVEKYEAKRKVSDLPEPLVPDLSCKYKKTEPCLTVSCPSVWTDGTTYNPDLTIWKYWYTTTRDDGSKVLVV